MISELRWIQELEHGDHACPIYDNDQDRIEVAAAFIMRGLTRNERCIYVSPPGGDDSVASALVDDGIDVGEQHERGALQCLTDRETYLRSGSFDPAAMLQFMTAAEERAIADGFAGLRYIVDMSWSLTGCSTDQLIFYESQLHRVIADRRVIVLCQYDRRLFDDCVLHDVVRVHPLVILGVEAYANPYYEPPELLDATAGSADDFKRRRLQWWIGRLKTFGNAAQELRASEARFRIFVDHATDAFFLHDENGTIVDVNEQACESLGYTREELIGMTPFDFDVDADPALMGTLTERLHAGEVVEFDTRHRRKDGSVFPVEVRIRPFEEQGRRLGIALAHDITQRKEAERALLESHALLQTIIEETTDAVFVKDLQGRYVMINSSGARALGRRVDEVIGKDDCAFYDAATGRSIMERDQQVIASGESQTYEVTLPLPNGPRTFLTARGVHRDAAGNVVGLVGISSDITDLKHLEEQLQQAQKMEAIGRLAGGIAHDFNNLLTVINSYGEMIFNSLRAGDPNRELAGEIRNAGERAAGLTRQLLAFSRKQVLQPRVVNLNTLLTELDKLLQRLIGEDIKLQLEPDPKLGLVTVDPGQFEQAITNLAVNARDAMPNGGHLIIRTRNLLIDQNDARRRAELPAGEYVNVSVCDTGEGMSAELQARIFEPFFTTKEPGKGTGLGLAMVYGFVKQSGGTVEVESEPARGTTFNILLPRAEHAAESPATARVTRTMPKGDETVLLVEDDDAVRRLARIVLQSSGYTLLEARDGADAINLAHKHDGRIDIVVTDLVMPQMGGREVAEVIARSYPDVRVLFMSGYTEDTAQRHGMTAPGVAFLQKPFSPLDLAAKVRDVLDDAETAPH